MSNKKRGGWSNPASKTNGLKASDQGRPRKAVRVLGGHSSFIVRDGDTVAIHDKAGVTLATAKIMSGALMLTNENGRTLTLILSE